MQIDIELQQQGITESIVNFFHSRTKNSHMTITKVYKATTYKGEELTGVKVNVTLKEYMPFGNDNTHHAQYTIDISKIREKRLNLLLK